jgi:hypothetical protein
MRTFLKNFTPSLNDREKASFTWLWNWIHNKEVPSGRIFFKNWAITTKLKQERCKHKKGSLGFWSLHSDYAVEHHRFIDGSERIRCILCSKFWTPTDPDWKQAVEMMENSTNRPQSSESIMFLVERDGAVVAHEPFQTVESLKAKYPQWDGTFKNAAIPKRDKPVVVVQDSIENGYGKSEAK